jgi:hypothetical protein
VTGIVIVLVAPAVFGAIVMVPEYDPAKTFWVLGVTV